MAPSLVAQKAQWKAAQMVEYLEKKLVDSMAA
jgi:hypothetical protein